MKIFDLAAKWRGLLITALLGTIVFGGAFLLPDAEAQNGLFVSSSNPADGSTVSTFPTTITLTFNAGLFGAPGPGELTVDGVPATGVSFPNSATLIFDIDPAANTGAATYDVVLPEGAVFGGAEVGNDEYQGSFTFAPTGSITIAKAVNAEIAGGVFEFNLGGEFLASVPGGGSFTLNNREPGTYTITETVPTGWGLTSIDCGLEQNNTAAANGVNIVLEAGEDVSCTFTNSTTIVCAVKNVGDTAAELGGYSPDDFPFSMQSAMAPVEPIEVQSCEGTAFNVAPGAQYLLSETISAADAPFVGFVGGACAAPESPLQAITAGSITTTAPQQGGGQVNCTFENDSIAICVSKEMGENAQLADIPADSISFSLNGGTAVAVSEGCAAASVQFAVAPGSTATIAEIVSPNLLAQPTAISCTQDVIERDPVAIGTANVAAGTVTIPTSASSTGDINCTFTNDVVIVCVTKSLTPAANQIADPDDFTFELVEPGFDAAILVPRAADEFCGEVEGSATGVDGYSLQPGTVFSITEQDPGPAIGLTDANCESGETVFELDEVGGRTISGISNAEGNLWVDCEFVNDSVVVCVTKQFGSNTDALESLEPGTFAVTVDATTVEAAAVPAIGSEGDLCADGESLQFGFNAAPGAEITLAETPPAGSPLRLVSATCSATGESSVDLPTTLVDQTASFTLTSQGPVDCVLTNDVAIVCVSKFLGEAAFFGTDVSAADFDFTVTVDDTTVSALDQQCVEDAFDQRIVASATYAVPPGATFTVTENESDSVAGLVAAECQGGETTVEADAGSSSVTYTLLDRESVSCEFVNDVVLLCVNKSLGPNAINAGFSASDFGFDVQVQSGTVAAAVTGFCSREIGDSPGQDGDLAPMPGDFASYGFAVSPGSAFTITETSSLDASAPIGLVAADCFTRFRGNESGPAVDLDAGTITIASDHESDFIDCVFVNETAAICVVKRLESNAVDAGYGLDNFAFQLEVDGQMVGTPVVPAPAVDAASCTSDQAGAGTATLLAAPGNTYAVTEIIGDGVRADVGSASCESTVSFGDRTVAFTPERPTFGVPDDQDFEDIEEIVIEEPVDFVSPFSYDCSFFNFSVPVTINKTVVNDDGAGLTVADFIFDVFDGDGALIASVSDPDDGDTGAIVYVAPFSTFTITERPVVGYELTSAACLQTGFDQALSGTSVTYELDEFELSTACTFVNDDIPPIPVCAMLILEEGDSGFTLADFNLELFKDGALVGQSAADGDFDPSCEDTTDSSASLLPSNLIKLGDVFADGSSFSFVAAVADPDGLLEFEPSSCAVDAPVATQALTGPAAVTFTADIGATRVLCIAQATAVAPETVTNALGSRPTFVAEDEPVLAAAQPVAATVPTQVVSTAIAVTGSSTTDTTLPVAFALLAAGFVGLGLDRVRRQRLDFD